ncbi:hypothetical protein VitviT2T_019162 [Vitis vinifera]|nr:hypothetical protein VitviT2T_019162 [Vitis vinifera]
MMMMIVVRFFEVSPEGKVPVIKVDGKWVADSDVITGSGFLSGVLQNQGTTGLRNCRMGSGDC